MCVRAQLPSARAERAEANFAPRGKSFASACFKTVKLCAAEIGFKMVKVCGRPETQPPPYGEGADRDRRVRGRYAEVALAKWWRYAPNEKLTR